MRLPFFAGFSTATGTAQSCAAERSGQCSDDLSKSRAQRRGPPLYVSQRVRVDVHRTFFRSQRQVSGHRPPHWCDTVSEAFASSSRRFSSSRRDRVHRVRCRLLDNASRDRLNVLRPASSRTALRTAPNERRECKNATWGQKKHKQSSSSSTSRWHYTSALYQIRDLAPPMRTFTHVTLALEGSILCAASRSFSRRMPPSEDIGARLRPRRVLVACAGSSRVP